MLNVRIDLRFRRGEKADLVPEFDAPTSNNGVAQNLMGTARSILRSLKCRDFTLTGGWLGGARWCQLRLCNHVQ